MLCTLISILFDHVQFLRAKLMNESKTTTSTPTPTTTTAITTTTIATTETTTTTTLSLEIPNLSELFAKEEIPSIWAWMIEDYVNIFEVQILYLFQYFYY